MAVTLDQANLGQNASDVSSSSIVLTTSAAADSLSVIVLGFMWASSTYDVSSISGGSLTWTIHPHYGVGAGGPGNHIQAIATAYAPSGLASSTAITITFAGAVTQKQVVASSFLGVSTFREDDDRGFDSNPAGANPTWTLNLTTISSGSLLLGFSEDSVIANSTPAGSAIETHEYDFATATNTVVLQYEVAGAAGAKTIGGQWDSAAFNGIAWNGIALQAAAAFPTTPVLDDFNRANSSPISGNWTEGPYADDTPLALVSNTVQVTSAEISSCWNSSSVGPDCEAFVTMTDWGSSGDSFHSVSVRMNDIDTFAHDGYLLQCLYQSPARFRFFKVTNGSAAQLGSDMNVAVSDGDKYGLRIVGNTLTAWHYTGGAWAQIGSHTDSSSPHTSAGYLALQVGSGSSVAIADNFGGGTYSPYAAEVLTDNPVAYYRMNEASGQPQDSSGNANHTTTVTGTPTYGVSGAITNDTAIGGFDGNDYFTAPDHPTLDIDDVWTVEAWIKRSDFSTSEQTICAKASNFGIYLLDNRLMSAKPGVSPIVDSTITIPNDGQYYHVVGTKNGATVKLYINGSDVTGTVNNFTCNDSNDPLYIGAELGPGSFFNGTIDEVAVYPTALSAERVAAHYAAALYDGPLFVGAGAGVERLTTGSATASKTGCTAGNLIVFHLAINGDTDDWSGWNTLVNCVGLDGNASALSAFYGDTGSQIHIGRVVADGTCSANFSVGASGEDIAARVYEFSGENAGTLITDVLENGTYPNIVEGNSGTSTSVLDAFVTTNAVNRLGLGFVWLRSAQATTDFTGETGGDWTEAAEYVGTTLTLQLQTAAMPSAGTIDGGSFAVASTYWACVFTALVPFVETVEKQTYYAYRRRAYR